MTIRNSKSPMAALVIAALALAMTMAPSAEAAPTCFGKRATKVGTKKPERILGTEKADVIVGLGGADQIEARGGNDLVCGGSGGDLIIGFGGDDRLDGGRGADTVFGMDGNDVLKLGNGLFNGADGGAGNDRIEGGASFDLAGFVDSQAPVNVDLETGIATGQGDDQLSQIEGVAGSGADDTLRGNSGTNVLVGGGGNDSITTQGNTGSLDTPVSTAVDLVVGDGDPQAPPGNDTLTGGSGLNIVDYSFSQAPMRVDLTLGTATGEGVDSLSGFQMVIGSDGNDSLNGDQNANGFFPFSGDDDVNGGAGEDVAILASAQNGVMANLTNGSATGEGTDKLTAIEDLWGSAGPDNLTGDAGRNEIYGLTGNDTIAGLAGDDLLDGGDSIDSLDGGDGTDQCTDAEVIVNCESSAAGARSMGLLWWQPTATTFRQFLVRLTLGP